ncbi:unnamed protein product [Rangifer tarandus platyrhynchus]|uniref:Uncharacterized protein n=2 Tax=Rangifer tarandus platyrhynchus TaxID=3082113 RepID=A0ABN8YC18_RANTA|nr:unnamed protein product [Rangifer tarandus platyrhynchus]
MEEPAQAGRGGRDRRPSLAGTCRLDTRGSCLGPASSVRPWSHRRRNYTEDIKRTKLQPVFVRYVHAVPTLKSVTRACNLFHFSNFLLLAFLGKKVTFISRGSFFGFISKHLLWLFCSTPKIKVLFSLFSFPSSVFPVLLLS